MKFSIYFLSLLLGTLLIFGCSEHIPDKHEQLYLDTADSLSLYKDISYLQKHLESNEQAGDYLKLDFIEFKEKHNLNNTEMMVLAKIMQGQVNIAKVLQDINSNIDRASEIKPITRDSMSHDYSFNKDAEKAYGPVVSDTNFDIQIMMAE